jgi:hypothetical protein
LEALSIIGVFLEVFEIGKIREKSVGHAG